MNKIKFIYNPISGSGVIKTKLDHIIERFQRHGITIVPHKLLGKNDIKKVFKEFDQKEFSGIVAAGGDGTLHDVINEIMSKDIKLPLGIIPAGTSNDFASFFGIPKKLDECIDVIIKQNLQSIDIGKINDKYFVNVVAGGILPSIAHKTDKKLKNSMGMLAYYLKAIEEIKNIKPFKIDITIDQQKFSEEIITFLVLNTSVAGGLRVMPEACIDDGYFNVCLVKNCNIPESAALFIKLLKGEHTEDKKTICLKGKNIIISSKTKLEIDIDGEKGHDGPLKIEVLSKALKVLK